MVVRGFVGEVKIINKSGVTVDVEITNKPSVLNLGTDTATSMLRVKNGEQLFTTLVKTIRSSFNVVSKVTDSTKGFHL